MDDYGGTCSRPTPGQRAERCLGQAWACSSPSSAWTWGCGKARASTEPEGMDKV